VGDSALRYFSKLHMLTQYCRERISHIKCPRSIDFMEMLPRLDNGKLYKQKLKERYDTRA
jgi:acyl-coenzyme A synthetase/AMP-(fatty) acid ligase